MSGLFESWLHKLVGALRLREHHANIIVVDWMSLAHQLYPDAVNHTKLVGKETAILIDWLQVRLLYYLHTMLYGILASSYMDCYAVMVDVVDYWL